MFPDENSLSIFQPLINPWYDSLKSPPESQKKALLSLVKEYEKTNYGQKHHASKIHEIKDFQTNFPIASYKALNPYLADVQKGNYSVLLPEPLACWVMTRGSTGRAKVLPATQTHLNQIFACGSRALINYVLRKRDFALLTGKILNLNFPSTVHTMVVRGQTLAYGYSSGTYARLNPMLNKISLIPKQEEIDALGSGISKTDWEKRFELAYQKALNENVTAVMGVTPVILSFARYVKRKHEKKPKDLGTCDLSFAQA